MVRRLRRIAPLKFGIVAGIVYALFSLIIVPFVALAMVAAAFIPSQQQQSSPFAAGTGIAGAIVFAVLAPFIYGILGFLFGLLGAWVYNVVAKWTGGFEFEVE